MNDTPALWSLTAQINAIKSGNLSCRELLELYIARIEKINPTINAVITTDYDNARQRADTADAALQRDEGLGPLHGIPITVKDALQTADLRSTGGARELKESIPEVDAPVVQAVREAGANIFGKTNLPRWSGDIQSYNDMFGTTSNPWNTEHVPGGSSGGAAAAVASGLTSFEIGTDIGGSIRFPSAFCGVFGHKPSFGIVPSTGYLDHQLGGTTEADVNVIGPIARSAEDLELLLGLMLKNESPWRVELPRPAAPLKDLRIASWLNDDFCPVDNVVADKHEDMVSRLEQAGYNISCNKRPAIDPMAASNLGLRLVSLATSQASKSKSGIDHRDWLEMHRQRLAINEVWARFFDDVDVLLMPVCFVPPFPHLQEGNFQTRTVQCDGEARPYADTVRWTILVGMAYLPSTVPPIGLGASGLPIGVQVVSKYGADLTSIRVAAAISELCGGYTPPPIALEI
ncbi:MAG: amidase family protein [Pseudomonadota bacterium]